MTSLKSATLLFVTFVVGGDLVGQELKQPVARLQLNDGETLVFLGDSITHQCLYTQYVEDYFYTRFPKRRLRFHNAGVGGAKALDALDRFEPDVASYQPKYVTVLLGMNDGSYRPFDQQTFDTYRRDMRKLIRKIEEIGATPILMTPTMYDSRAARMRKKGNSPEPRLEFYNSVLAYYGSWLREVALAGGHGFVDMYGPLNQLTWMRRKARPKFTMIRDAVHPGPGGQLVMAYALLSDMGLRRPLSAIRIVHDADGKPVANTKGGELTNLTVTENEVKFTWLADGLPYVLPPQARVGVQLLQLKRRLSEVLAVHVLPPGRYQLTIDGKDVGTYSATALERHIELQANPQTPQYAQALAVVDLNRQRNAGPVRDLRREWSHFQSATRTRRRLEKQPDDAELQDRLAKQEAQLEGRKERIAAAEKAAREIEDRIFTLNQPRARSYVLRRVQD